MHQINRVVRKQGPVIRQNCFLDMEYLTFPLLEETGLVKHLFTTRTGGVSEGIFSTLNLSFQRGDNPEHVLENYRRVGKILGITPERMVTSKQTHTTNIRLVTASDAGKGVVRPLDYEDIDGLITKERGIALVTSYADCVPLYFVDTENQAIGLAHSGWRGTVEQIGAGMVDAMQKAFGTRPEALLAAIGPSICQECYEVSEDVADAFAPLAEETESFLKEIRESGYYDTDTGIIVPGKREGKYQLDLWLANLLILRKAGIPLEQIAVTDICTCHNPEYLFSHRASDGKRGNLCAFLMINEN